MKLKTGPWVDWALVLIIIGWLIFYFGWHEFDGVRSWLRGGQ